MRSGVVWIQDPVVQRQLETVDHLVGDIARRGVRCPPFHAQLLSGRSKRLRSALLLLAGRIGNAAPERALLAAASGIELVHEATLYHDDIVDEAPTRRGQPSVQFACGAATAAFAGTELLFATGELFADLPPSLRRAIGHASNRLCRGQLRELEMLGDLDATVRDRLRVMRDKTATLFALAARLGATLGGSDRHITQQLVRFGTRFGLCFQLADDLRDLVAPAAVLGRQLGADLRDGVYTLPVLYALRLPGADAQQLRRWLLRLQRHHDEVLISRALGLLVRTSGMSQARATLGSWIASARSDIDTLPVDVKDGTRQSLHALLQRLLVGVDETQFTGTPVNPRSADSR